MLLLPFAAATISAGHSVASSSLPSPVATQEPPVVEVGAFAASDGMEDPGIALRVLGRHAGDAAVRFQIANVGTEEREIRYVVASGYRYRYRLTPDVRLVPEPCDWCPMRHEPVFRSAQGKWATLAPGESLAVDLRLEWPEGFVRPALFVRRTETTPYSLASPPVRLADLPVLETISDTRAAAIADSAMAALLGAPVPETVSWSGERFASEGPEGCSWWTSCVEKPEYKQASRLTRSVVQFLPGSQGCRCPADGYCFSIDVVTGEVLATASASCW